MGPDLDSEAGAGSQRAVDATPSPPLTSSGPPNPCDDDDVIIVTPKPRKVLMMDLTGSGGDTYIEVDDTQIKGSSRKKRKSSCSGEEVRAQKPGQFRAPKQERLEPQESRCQGGSPSLPDLTRPNDVLIKKEMLETSRALHKAEVDGTSVDAAQCGGPSQGTPRLPGTPSYPGHRDVAVESAGNDGIPLSEVKCVGLACTGRSADGVHGDERAKEVILLDDPEDQHGRVSGGEGHRPASTAPSGASVRGGRLLQAASGPPSQPQVSGLREADEQQPSSCGSGVSITTPSGESSADSSLPVPGNLKLAGKHGQRPWDTYRGRGQWIRRVTPTRQWGTYCRGRGQRRVIPTAIGGRRSTGPGSTNYQQAQTSVSEDVRKALDRHPCHPEHASVCQPVGSVPNVPKVSSIPNVSSRRVCPWKKHNFGIPCWSDGTQAAKAGGNVVLTASEPAASGLDISQQPWSKKRKRLVWYLRCPQSLPRLQACLSNWMAAMRRCELCSEELDDLNLCTIQAGHQTDQEDQSSAPSVDIDALVEAIETGVFPVTMYACLWHAVCCPINGAPPAAPTTTSCSPHVEAVQLTEGESFGAGTAATGPASSPNGRAQREAHVSSRPNSGTTDVSDEMAVTSTTASLASAASLLLAARGRNVRDSRGEDLPAPPPSKRPVEEADALKRQCAGLSQGTPRLPGTPSCSEQQEGAAEVAGSGGILLSEAGCGGLACTERLVDGAHVEEGAEGVIPLDDPEDQHGLVSGGDGHGLASMVRLEASVPDSLATFHEGIKQIVASQLAWCGVPDPLAVPALPTSSENASAAATLDSAATGEGSRPSLTTDSGRIDASQLQSPPPSQEIPNNNTAVVAVRIFPKFIYYCRTSSAFRSIHTVSGEPAVEYRGQGRTLISLEVHMVKAKPIDVFVASLDGELLCYDPDTGGDHTGSYPIGGGIRCSALDWGRVYLGLDTGEIAEFDIKSRKKKSYQCFMEAEAVTGIRAERRQKLLCAVSCQGGVAVYTNNGAQLWKLDRLPFVPTCIGVNKQCIYVPTPHKELYKLEDGNVQGPWACEGEVVGIHFYQKFIIHCSRDGKICVYCINDKELQCKLVFYGAGKNNITCMDVRGNLVATGNADGNWEVVELNISAAQLCEVRSCNLKFARPEDVLHHCRQEHPWAK